MISPAQSHKEPHPHQPTRRFRPGVLRFSAAQFLITLVLMLVGYPFVMDLKYGDVYEAFFMTTTLTMAVLAVGHRRRTLVIATVLLMPALAGKWLNHFSPDKVPAPWYLAATILCLAFVVIQLFRYILRAPDVDSEVLCAAVGTYLMLGLLWAFAYKFVNHLAPDSFIYTSGPASGHSMKGFTAIYYSFCTLSTVGYGDIVPGTNVVRMLASVESITGVFYGTILVARLVAIFSNRRPAAGGTLY